MTEQGQHPASGSFPWGNDELAVVIPCYNAGERLLPVVLTLSAFPCLLFLIDDGSTDDAVDTAMAQGLEAGGRIKKVRFEKNQGKGHALLTGFRKAIHHMQVRCVATLDADGQHDPAELPRLYTTFLREQADLLIGSRQFSQGHVPLRSRVGNLVTAGLTNLLLGTRLPDTQSGFRLHSRRLVNRVLAKVSPGRYETEMEIVMLAVRQGFIVVSEPIQTIYEEGNTSSHFNKVGDSWRVCRRLVTAAFRYRRGKWNVEP